MKIKVLILTFIYSLLSGYPLNSFSQTKVACIGNSVTFGLGLTDPEANYPYQLAKLLGKDYLVENFGVSGSTLLRHGHKPYTSTDDYKKVLQYAPDIAIIHLGLNDTDPRNWPAYRDDFISDYYYLMDQLRAVNPEVTIYVCSLTPIFSGHPRFKSGTHIWHGQIQTKIKDICADTSLNYIDLNSALNNRPDLFPDNLHPNEKGYKLIAEAIHDKISPTPHSLQVSSSFMDNMVLQRNKKINITGLSAPFSNINFTIGQLQLQGKADKYGHWEILLPPQKEGGPFDITIQSTDEQITRSNILFGDVWLISGQSNMEFPLKASIPGVQKQHELPNLSRLRLLHFKGIADTHNIEWAAAQIDSVNDLQYFQGAWEEAHFEQIQDMSAIGYHFADHLLNNINIPIGIIQLAVGGSGIESWIDRKTLESDPLLVDMLDHWRGSDFIMPWVRERANKNLSQSQNLKTRHPFEPAYNFESGVSLLQNTPISGVLWYQGESNVHNPELYSLLFSEWLASWRKHFNDKKLPVYYVQLSSINRPEWPIFRDMQRRLLTSDDNIYMVTNLDLGDSTDVHPKWKQEIGKRLAHRALTNSYAHSSIPKLPISFTVSFTQEKRTLELIFPVGTKITTANGTSLYGFEVMDNKGQRSPVQADIKNNKIQIHIANTSANLNSLRYAWKPFTRANVLLNDLHPLPTFEQKLIDGVKIKI